jgi:Ca-activated chloride channel family protein
MTINLHKWPLSRYLFNMKRVLIVLLSIGFSAHAQVTTEDYLGFCDELVIDASNSIKCLRTFYKDLSAFRKNADSPFKYYESYNCVPQPKQQSYDKVKIGTDNFYKPLITQMWKLYNDTYLKDGEIVAYLRLEDYKKDIDQGFRLIREMQVLHNGIADIRNKIAGKVLADAKLLAPGAFTKPYQLFLNAIVHEEELLGKLSMSFNEEYFSGFAQEEILKSYLETDDLLQNLKPSNFRLPDIAALRSCYEGLQLIQKHKQSAIDAFNNSDTFDGQHAIESYENLLQYFDGDILYFFAFVSAQGRAAGIPLRHYPVMPRRYDFDTPPKAWVVKNLEYSEPTLDTITAIKQNAPLPLASFNELNLIVNYINECVGSMENLASELRSEEYTWQQLKKPKRSNKKRIVKFEHFKIPVSIYGLISKNSRNIPPPYPQSIMQRVDDLQQIMLVTQDKLIGLSQFIANGTFDDNSADYVDHEVKAIEHLYSQFDFRKEKLYLEVRKIYFAYPPAKSNSWIISSGVLLKAADDSRSLLRQLELKLYHGNAQTPSTSNIHDDRRDLITNELKYMNGIQLLGKANGNCPYTPYEYIPDYLNTTEEKIQKLPAEIKDKDKVYRDILYMHNRVIDQYNKFAELGLGDNEYGRTDPMRPVRLLSDIYQLQKYHYDPPKPEVTKVESVIIAGPPIEQPKEIYTLEGSPYNNMVLLLDVSSSMNAPERLPQLKSSFQQMIRLMRTEDEVSIVVYSGKAAVLLSPTSAVDTSRIDKAIQNLKSDGRTNVADGLSLAYKTARKNLKSNGNNRIILATDGEFNVGESLYTLAAKNAADISLTVFDFSQKPDPIKAIQALAEKGKGNYVKVTPGNSLEVLVREARKN